MRRGVLRRLQLQSLCKVQEVCGRGLVQPQHAAQDTTSSSQPQNAAPHLPRISPQPQPEAYALHHAIAANTQPSDA